MISGSGQPCDMPTTASHDGKSARESSRLSVSNREASASAWPAYAESGRTGGGALSALALLALGRLLGPAAAVAAVGLRDSRQPPTSGGWAAMDAESAKMGTRFCDPAAWFDKRHRSRVGELTILFSSLGLVTAISTRRARYEATRPGSGLSVGYMPLAAAPRSTKRSRFTLPPSDDRCLRRALTGKEAHHHHLPTDFGA